MPNIAIAFKKFLEKDRFLVEQLYLRMKTPCFLSVGRRKEEHKALSK
jgi:hypothetical protein